MRVPTESMQAVCLRPDDDTPRLDAAEALEPEDPRRARFIRLSCELAGTPEADRRHATLEAGLARCMPTPGWHADLAGIRGLSWGYDRGFVTSLRARADVLIREAPTVLSHPITEMVVEVKGREATDLVAAGVLAPVRSLALIGPVKAQREILASGDLGRLRELSLVIDERGLAEILDLPSLGGLDSLKLRLQGDAGEAVRRLAAAGGFSRLRHLELRTVAGPVDVAALAGAQTLAGLTSLELGSLDDAQGAKALGQAESLRSLLVWDLDEEAGPVLCAGPLIARLGRLKVQHPGRRAVIALAANPGSVGLRRLELGGLLQTKEIVGDEGVEALARSPHLSGLEQLDLGGCAMGPGGARALADVAAFPHLRVLNLQRRNRLGIDGARALARWAALEGVHTLYLPLEEPDPAAVLEPLLQSGTLEGLQRLDLWGPREEAGDAVVRALAHADLPDLSHLAMARHVNSPSFRAGGAKALLGAAGLPSLAILWARLMKVPKAARTALCERYLVFDSQSDSGLDTPLSPYRS